MIEKFMHFVKDPEYKIKYKNFSIKILVLGYTRTMKLEQ